MLWAWSFSLALSSDSLVSFTSIYMKRVTQRKMFYLRGCFANRFCAIFCVKFKLNSRKVNRTWRQAIHTPPPSPRIKYSSSRLFKRTNIASLMICIWCSFLSFLLKAAYLLLNEFFCIKKRFVCLLDGENWRSCEVDSYPIVWLAKRFLSQKAVKKKLLKIANSLTKFQQEWELWMIKQIWGLYMN